MNVSRAFAVVAAALAACAPGRAPRSEVAVRSPASTASTPSPASANVAPSPTKNAWTSACAAVATCGACLNTGPCQWCAADSRCGDSSAACAGGRAQQPGQCATAPLDVAKQRHAPLAAQLGRYEIEREVVDADLSGTKEVSFFLNTGDCFAVLAEPLDGGEVHLGYALRIRGTPQPGDRVASPEPKTGGRDGAAELSPEFCPWEHQPLAIWNARANAIGRIRLHLLRRAHPDPARLARERPAPPQASSGGRPQGGTCSSFECGEDCGSERRSCDLDCFRNGSHEPAAATICKNVCIQLENACHRGCAVPCP